MKPYVKWSSKEHAILTMMRSAGASRGEIASALQRSESAVTSQISNYNRSMRAQAPLPRRISLLPVVSIPKAEVPEWYALGWRFVGFDSGRCVFEWRSSREPRWPAQTRGLAYPGWTPREAA